MMRRNQNTYDGKPRAAALSDAAFLVRAMGGPLATPRRLCDAAARLPSPEILDRACLDRCVRRSAARSAFVDVEALERLVVGVAWRQFLDAGVTANYFIERAAFGEVCEAANVDNAAAVWAEVLGGHLPPLAAYYVPAEARGTPMTFSPPAYRDPGDVRAGDVALVAISEELSSAVLAFAVTSRARGDAVASFALTRGGTMSPLSLNGLPFLRCAILDDLAFRRPGERDDAAGAARVEAALASLLEEEHAPRPLAAGDAIEVYDGPGDTWSSGRLVAASIDDSVSPQLVEGGAAPFGTSQSIVVQLDGSNATRQWKRAHVRRPAVDKAALPRAIAVLADALRTDRNVFAARLLASPLLADALAYRTTTGSGSGVPISPLDHAIQGGNGVGVRLLLARYGEDVFAAYQGSMSSLYAKLFQSNLSPARRADVWYACGIHDEFGVFTPPSSVAAMAAGGELFFPHKWALNEVFLQAPILRVLAKIRWKELVGARAEVDELTAQGAALVEVIEKNWGSSLWWAARMGHAQIVKFLMRRRRGGTFNGLGHYVADALFIAGAEDRPDCVAAMILGTTAQLAESARETLLQKAIELGNVATLDRLRTIGVSLHYEQTNGDPSSLGHAALTGQPDAARALLRDKDCLAALREHRSDAVYYAAGFGHFDVLGVLLEAGGFPFGAEETWRPRVWMPNVADGDSPLAVAAGKGRSECVVMLLNLGACVDGTSNGRTALQCAVMEGWLGITEILLEAGASVAARDDSGFSAFQYALRTCDSEQEEMLALLLRERPDECDLEGSLRHLVASVPEAAAAKLLISRGADPNDESLHLAAFHLALLNNEAARKTLAELIGLLVSSGASAAARSTLACKPPERAPPGHGIALPGLTPRELAECGVSLEAREAAISALEDALAKKRRF